MVAYVDTVSIVSFWPYPRAGSYGVQCTNVALGGVSSLSAMVARSLPVCDVYVSKSYLPLGALAKPCSEV